jgi:hypothetical protein
MCSGYGALNVVLQHHFVDIAVERLLQTVNSLRQTLGLLQLHLLDVTTQLADAGNVSRRYRSRLRAALRAHRSRPHHTSLATDIEGILDEWDSSA